MYHLIVTLKNKNNVYYRNVKNDSGCYKDKNDYNCYNDKNDSDYML